ncbi:phosphoribosyl transferase [Cordyceps militaris CM01]|uniref:Phosphoribosyl transferase n=1 Tax=Cordyceps militaris (strain CM01) TaxID=983644 RepID=G3JCB7_CORMM|nr:phosphoribosyl transferase [Cordyceps militaris CM01]EGX93782.1 phosphoribosyl transferase [Cordyceps militaris CM01]
MATLDDLKVAQYSIAFGILLDGARESTYQSFIIPQLSRLLEAVQRPNVQISVLEIGPGPQSVLGQLPLQLRQGIGRYTAFEPNRVYASMLEKWLLTTSTTEVPFPSLGDSPRIHVKPFTNKPEENEQGEDKFDIILFCHSMYGMKPRSEFITQALGMLNEKVDSGMVIVFHRDTSLAVDGLVCRHTASFPSGIVSIPDEDKPLDHFACLIAGGFTQDDENTQLGWRQICRTLCMRDKAHPGHLLFRDPGIMMAFTRDATALPELTAQVPLVVGRQVKNRQARRHRTAFVVRPTEPCQVQKCVYWALKHRTTLAVIGGSHGGHCLQPNVVSVDMAAFNSVEIVRKEKTGLGEDLVVAGAGCKTEDIIKKAMTVGLTVPLGSCPSVGAGLWLQGGINHLARLRGLTCDVVVGAVMVSVKSGRFLLLGQVPSQCQPDGAVRPDNEADLLWALRGAGTNFGIVISVVFRASAAMNYSIWQWNTLFFHTPDARQRLADFGPALANELPRNSSADVFLYYDADRLCIAVSLSRCSDAAQGIQPVTAPPLAATAFLGPEQCSKSVDVVGLYDTEMYISTLHGGHSGGKTSSFKRCIFLREIGELDVPDLLLTAVEHRPSPLCYLHLLHAGGAAAQVAVHATAFGCRNWTYACVITGVWPRDQDGTATARAAVDWVYHVANKLLPFSTGVYGADLGPDPRDESLAVHAFGPNRLRLACLKRSQDPLNVLAYTCPLLSQAPKHRLIIITTGKHGAGKDYCSELWAGTIMKQTPEGLQARVISISDATKQEYAAATGADLARLRHDRAYKEEHRLALTRFFQDQLLLQPRLREDHFLRAVYEASADVDVLIITGMRDEDPVARFSHLVPHTRLIEVRVTASRETRQARRQLLDEDAGDGDDDAESSAWMPTLRFQHEGTGDEAVQRFAERVLVRFVHEDLRRLQGMVRVVPNFPRVGMQFRHVLDIVQQPGGLALCTALLRTHFTGDWADIDAIACCEAGGFLFAPTLAAEVGKPVAVIRHAGKLPPTTLSIVKSTSHISSSPVKDTKEARIGADDSVLSNCRSVVVVDDVLASGNTLCDVLRLLGKAGIAPECINVLVVAEFPCHRGREKLRQHGFGRVTISSLLIYTGA